MIAGSADAALPLIVLHGANGAAAEMAPLLDRLRSSGRPVLAPDMLGHGGRPVPAAFSIAEIAKDLIAHCDAHRIQRAHWFGYSVGGLVALWTAVHRPDRVASVATLTTKIVYDRASVAHAMHLTDAARVERANPARAEVLAGIHAPQNWRVLIGALRTMFEGFGAKPPIMEEELAGISQPLLAMGGLDDPLVPAGEVRRLATLAPNAISALFPGIAHPLATAPLDTVARTLLQFLDDPARFTRSARVTLHDFRWDR